MPEPRGHAAVVGLCPVPSRPVPPRVAGLCPAPRDCSRDARLSSKRLQRVRLLVGYAWGATASSARPIPTAEPPRATTERRGRGSGPGGPPERRGRGSAPPAGAVAPVSGPRCSSGATGQRQRGPGPEVTLCLGQW
ncbi:hypothetical protein VULLAG_LOCUS13744 [Vulpes lagopus]